MDEMRSFRRRAVLGLGAMLAGATPSLARAHGENHVKDHGTPKSGPVIKEQKPWGIAGDAKAVRRTLRVTMSDSMRFDPSSIDVRQGETVRFVIHNTGKLMHEFVIGTKKELDDHAEQMKRFPNMQHEEPYMAHVAPGQSGEIVWRFNRAGSFDFGCLIAGHYDAGMVGRIVVRPRG